MRPRSLADQSANSGLGRRFEAALAERSIQVESGVVDVVVRQRGREVFRKRWGPALNDYESTVMVPCGSSFKPVLATALCRLLAREGIGLDQAIIDYAPRLVDSATTAAHILDHQAGLPHIRAVAPELGDLRRRAEITDRLRGLNPMWPSGSRTGYHALSYGFLLSALCEAVAEVPVADVVRREVLAPAGINESDLAVGGPPTGATVASVEAQGVAPIPWRPLGRSPIYQAMYPIEELVPFLNAYRQDAEPVLSCGVPATASGLAQFYDHVLELDEMPVFAAPTFDQVMRQPLQWGRGFLSGAGVPSLKGMNAFGLPGFGGAIGLAFPAQRVAVGVVTTVLDVARVVPPVTDEIVGAVACVLR